MSSSVCDFYFLLFHYVRTMRDPLRFFALGAGVVRYRDSSVIPQYILRAGSQAAMATPPGKIRRLRASCYVDDAENERIRLPKASRECSSSRLYEVVGCATRHLLVLSCFGRLSSLGRSEQASGSCSRSNAGEELNL